MPAEFAETTWIPLFAFSRISTTASNYTIATFWDAGFRVLLGDDLNGFVAETRVPTFADAAQWLAIAAITHHPDSEFAKKCRT